MLVNIPAPWSIWAWFPKSEPTPQWPPWPGVVSIGPGSQIDSEQKDVGRLKGFTPKWFTWMLILLHTQQNRAIQNQNHLHPSLDLRRTRIQPWMSPVTSSQSPVPKYVKKTRHPLPSQHPATWPLVCKASGKMTTVQPRRSSQTWKSRRSWNSGTRCKSSWRRKKTCETGTRTGWSMVFTSHAKERKPTILGVGVPTGNNDAYENHKVYPSIGFVWDPPIYTVFSSILPV